MFNISGNCASIAMVTLYCYWSNKPDPPATPVEPLVSITPFAATGWR